MDEIFRTNGDNMGLRYVYGLNNSYSQELFNLIEDELSRESEDSVIAITPNKSLFEKKLRKYGIIDKNLRLTILDLEDICNISIKRSKFKKYNYLNETSKAMIISNLLSSCTSLKVYNNLSNSIQIANLFSATIKNLKKSMINPNKLKDILELMDESSTRDKLIDIYKIYNEYEKYKESIFFVDREDSLSIAHNVLNDFELFKKSSVYVVGFDFINKLEEFIFDNILNQASRVTISITTDSVDRSPTLNSAHLYKPDVFIANINTICKKYNIDREEDVIINRTDLSDKEHLYKFLYKYPFNTYEGKTEYLHVTEYASMHSEVEGVAYEIKKLISNGVNYEDIALVSFNLKEYDVILNSVFHKFEIPFNIKSSTKLSSTPIVRLINNIIKLYSRNYLSKDVSTYLKSIESISLEEALSLTEYLNSSCIERFNFQGTDLEILERNSETEAIFLIYDLLYPVRNLFEKLDSTESIFDKCSVLYNEVFSMYFGKEVKASQFEEIINLSDINVWNKFSTTVSTIARVFENENKTTLEFFDLIEHHINHSSINDEDATLGKITVLDDKANLQEFDYIFLLNANDGVISFNEDDETLINAIDKRLLLNKGVHIVATDEELRLREQYSVLKLLTLANKSLYISIPAIDRAEAKLKKSPLITRLRQLFLDCNSISYDTKYWNASEQEYEIHLPRGVNIQHLIQYLNKGDLDVELEQLSELMKITDYEDDIKTISNALTFGNETKCEDTYSINEMYFGDTFSVSKLEKYNKCAFSYFIEYGLNIKEPSTKEPDFRHLGIFVHEIIEKFITKLSISDNSWSDIDLEYIRKEANNIADQILKSQNEHILLSTKRHERHVYKLVDIAINSIYAISKHVGNSFFSVLGNEISFGDKSTYPPIIIRLDNGKRVKLRGQIDRADSYEVNNTKYIRIIDYKTGDMKLSLSDIYNGLQLQLITYLDAIINASKDEEYTYKPAGVFYLKLDKPYVKLTPKESLEQIEDAQLKELRMNGVFSNESNIPKLMDTDVYDGLSKTSLNINARFKTDGTLMKATPGLTNGEFEDLIKYTKEVIKSTITTMLQGNISINPILKGNSTPCSYCKYKLVCMFDETLKGNRYKHIQQLKPIEALQNIRGKVSSCNE